MATATLLPPHALRGVRVVDFSHVIAGPFATFHLAQMGADVTKVEKPGGGDVMRRHTGARAFTAFNAGKHMREIDIASQATIIRRHGNLGRHVAACLARRGSALRQAL